MIRGLSTIPRGGGKPEGKEGDCITTLGALRPIEGARLRTHSFGAFLFRRQLGTGLPWYALRATSHTPVPNWLMGMKSKVQAVEYTPSENT